MEILSAKYSNAAIRRLSFTLAGSALFRRASNAIFSLTFETVDFKRACPAGNHDLKVVARVIAAPRYRNANHLFDRKYSKA